MINDTIAAISTPYGNGGVAMIRVSGDEAADVARRVFFPKGKDRAHPADVSRLAVFGEIRARGSLIDEGICVFYDAPASYTGEDVAEITCHGGIAVTRLVLEAALRAGARLAEPGEFTRRAYVNGKLTLTEVEAVGLLINADTEARAALAATAASGALSRRLTEISDSLTGAIAELYAAIDYPDEDIGDLSRDELVEKLRPSLAALDRLEATHKYGGAVADGVPTAILGAPNSGKSTLYNAICGKDAAIVTDVEGTTRDVLTETVTYADLTLLLHDTAGVRETSDPVEIVGVDRALAAAREAALVLFTYDLSRPLGENELEFARSFIEENPRTATVAVFTKCDLPRVMSADDIERLCSLHGNSEMISVKTGDGMAALEECVGELFDAYDYVPNDVLIWSSQQRANLGSALDLLYEANAALKGGEPIDAACSLAETALSRILAVDGRGVSEAVVESIFSRFCVGK